MVAQNAENRSRHGKYIIQRYMVSRHCCYVVRVLGHRSKSEHPGGRAAGIANRGRHRWCHLLQQKPRHIRETGRQAGRQR